MSNSFKNPLIPLIVNPVNIDRAIQNVQVSLSEMGWLEKCFGRAYNSYKRDVVSRPSIYPEVWQGLGKDLLNVLPNDNLKSQSFFKVEEPIEVLEYNPNGFSLMKATVSIIFWFNLKEIDDTADYRFIELLKGRTQRLLTAGDYAGTFSLEVKRVYDTPEQVFRGYDINKIPAETLIQPYGGFRFETEFVYVEDCPDSVYGDMLNPGALVDNGYLLL